MGGLSYGLNPALGAMTQNGNTIVNNGIHELWAQGRMAVVANAGTLVAPLTRTQYQNRSVARPFQLFSHSDQVSQYQGGRADQQAFTGWGGKIADLRTAPDNPGGLIPMITSINGAQLFTAEQENFYNALRTWRNERASRDGVPPYLIAHNDSLMQMATMSIKTHDDLLQVKGLGEKRVQKYGDEILRILNTIQE